MASDFGAAGNVRTIAEYTRRTDDIRDLGRRIELLDLMWWPSNNTNHAGDMLLSVSADPDSGKPNTMRYRRVNDLYRESSASSMEPSGELIFTEGTIFVPNIEPEVNFSPERVNAQRISERLHILGNPRQGSAASQVFGTEDSIIAAAAFHNPRRIFPVLQPFDPMVDSFDAARPPAVLPVVYTVLHATGRWKGATNVIVGYVADAYGLPREVAVVRGMRE